MQTSGSNRATTIGAVLIAIGAYFGIIGALHVYLPFVRPWMYMGLGGGWQALIGAPSALAGAVVMLWAHDPQRDTGVANKLIVIGTLFLLIGIAVGLLAAPAEQYMGETQRIMYVHVPTAWNGLLAITFGFVFAIAYLFSADYRYDCRLEASIEVGVLFAFLLCVQGSIWAKPTWGVWWDWDPRLTTTAVLLFAFLGILALRNFVEDPLKRATWSAVATIIAYVDVPIVYFSVKWWNSLHQQQSLPNTVSSAFHLPLRACSFGILLVMLGFVMIRSRIAALRLDREMAEPVLMHEAGEVA